MYCGDKYSNITENFEWPNTREDSSDSDDFLTESMATMKTIIVKFSVSRSFKTNRFENFLREDFFAQNVFDFRLKPKFLK